MLSSSEHENLAKGTGEGYNYQGLNKIIDVQLPYWELKIKWINKPKNKDSLTLQIHTRFGFSSK
jgi:hypothetical protein